MAYVGAANIRIDPQVFSTNGTGRPIYLRNRHSFQILKNVPGGTVRCGSTVESTTERYYTSRIMFSVRSISSDNKSS